MNALRGVPTDADIKALQERNAQRAAAAIAALGRKWAAHPESTHRGILNQPRGKQ